MIADIQFIKGFLERLNNFGVAMAEVKNTAVAVAVNQAFSGLRVPDVRSFAPAENKLHIISLESLHLARVDIFGEAPDNFIFGIQSDMFHCFYSFFRFS